MPSTRIETGSGWIGDRRAEVLEAVQRALVIGIKIPEDDRDIRLTEHDPANMITSASASPRRTIIEITLFIGLTIEAKRRLYAALVEQLAPFGLIANDIKVTLIEVSRENWGLGGLPASEIDVGFKIEV
ncbi:tautomerase family protein [Devosia sp.]|uniref:tautomerase family protein n=1 Tax=Devosia sp. TaxID=1871048 RepID=UPI003263BFC3